MSDSTDGLTGTIADRYRIDRKIGEGGMATVYLAYDERHDSRVALKVLRPELASRLGGERFVREIRITAQLQHPNILPVFDSGESDGNAFYVMPYVEGQTLEQRLKSGPLPLDEALSMAAEVADALAYAHERGFVHRDVKPSNIMLTHGHAMLADFGIARAIDVAGGEQLTEAGLAIGTAAYMSPEQALGQSLDGRTDIYSLGCVLYEMLAGTPPFSGSARVVLARHSADTVPSLRVVRDTVPEQIEQLVFKALAKTPADRFATAAAFREALRQAGANTVATAVHVQSEQKTWLWRALAGAALVGVIIVVARQTGLIGNSNIELDANRVSVLPLRVSPAYQGTATGEDIATLVMNALDDAPNDLRWIDGMGKLAPAIRDSLGAPGDEEARRYAREGGAAHFVTGTITPHGNDSVTVALGLWDTATGRQVMRAPSEALTADVYGAAIKSANQLLSELIGGAPKIDEAWQDRKSLAIASFLRGEAEFRRTHLEEALDHYRAAVAEDSSFALAAIRGAQTAAWAHRPGEADALLQIALRQPMPPRYTEFARGYASYLAGNADSAVAALRRATTADPEMAAAWMQLGEVYSHLLPKEGNPDTLALAAFEAGRRLDPTATNLLFHLIEIHLLRSDTASAAPLLEQFLAAEPDSVLADKLVIMNACVRDGASAVDWTGLAAGKPFELLSAAKTLAVAAARPTCARAGFRALLAVDTSSTDGYAAGRRYSALKGLQGLLVSAGRTDEAVAIIDSYLARWGLGSTLFLLDAIVDDAFADRSRTEVERSIADFGEYACWPSTLRLWEVGVLHAMDGRLDDAERIATVLAERAAAEGGASLGLKVESVRAHLALARGQTDEALDRFESLVPAILPADALSWDEFAPLGVERLALVRLLIDRGEFRRAIAVANVFDSPAPIIYTLFIRTSLELRVEAANGMENPFLASQFSTRLDALTSSTSATY